MSIAPWNTAADAEIIYLLSQHAKRDSEDMPRKAIDIHFGRLIIQEADMDHTVAQNKDGPFGEPPFFTFFIVYCFCTEPESFRISF